MQYFYLVCVCCLRQGKVARTAYGNLELFLPCMLPVGATHVQSQLSCLF